MHNSNRPVTTAQLVRAEIIEFHKKLEAAFPVRPQPFRIVNASRLAEPARANSMLSGKMWSALDAAEMQRIWGDTHICSCFPFLTGEAFRYYIPFFLYFCLTHSDAYMIEVDVEHIIYMLGGEYAPDTTPAHIDDIIGSFTDAQRKAIGEFVKIAMRLFDGRIPHSDFDHLVERYVQSP